MLLISMLLGCISFDSYIKPQRSVFKIERAASCISFDSYIKPQPVNPFENGVSVVYLLIPTSNHNQALVVVYLISVVYLLIPTSNHNFRNVLSTFTSVVYLLIPTSNHNHR